MSKDLETLRKAVRHMCRRAYRQARQTPAQEEDLKTMRDMVQILKELAALTRELEESPGHGETGSCIRLEQEVEDFAR
ncbi:MAG: hypothetical protein ACI3V3_00590 [Faecousia sp.]